MSPPTSLFSTVAYWTARQMGRSTTFALACFIVIAWAASGPFFHFSDTWQLVINTGTTIITFLMVFLLQHAQNRDASAIQLKLDELIRVNQDARNNLLSLEDLSEADLEKIKATFTELAERGLNPDDLAEAHEELTEAKEGIEQAQTAIGRLKEFGS